MPSSHLTGTIGSERVKVSFGATQLASSDSGCNPSQFG